MPKNVGPTDRLIRVALGVVLGVLAFSLPGIWAWVTGILAVLAVFTAATGFCLLYALFGLDTRPLPKQPARG